MNFFQKIPQSIYSPAFYQKVKNAGLGTAIRYFLLLSLIVSFLFTAYRTVEMFNAANFLRKPAFDLYPEELIVKIRNGKVWTNVSQPYLISLSEHGEVEGNIMVIDTKTPFSQAKFDQYNAPAWLTRDSLFVKSGEGEIRGYELTSVEDFMLNHALVTKWLNLLYQYMPAIVTVLAVLVFIFIYITQLFNLIILLLVALVIWLFAKKMSPRLTYKQSYIVAIYAATAGLIINFLLAITYSPIKIPFLLALLTIGVFLSNFYTKFATSKKKK